MVLESGISEEVLLESGISDKVLLESGISDKVALESRNYDVKLSNLELGSSDLCSVGLKSAILEGKAWNVVKNVYYGDCIHMHSNYSAF